LILTKSLTVVIPVYNEESNVDELVQRVRLALDSIEALDFWEILFCVDPSTDRTEEKIELNHKLDSRVKMIRFSRRFGQPAATMAGIHTAETDAVIVMDADLQDPPETLVPMVNSWLAGAKIVIGQRRSRTGEPFTKKIIARLGYSFLNKFSEVPIPQDSGDFRLLDRQVLNELRKFQESNSFLRGLVALVGFEQTVVEFDRPKRYSGRTKYSRLFGSLRIGFNGVVGYSTALLSVSTILGTVFSAASILISIGYGVATLAGAPFPLGNPTIVVSVLFVGGINLLTVGILGLYIGRIYEEVKSRPRFIIEKSLGLEDSQ